MAENDRTVNDALETARRTSRASYLTPANHVEALSEAVLDWLGQRPIASWSEGEAQVAATLAGAHATEALRERLDELAETVTDAVGNLAECTDVRPAVETLDHLAGIAEDAHYRSLSPLGRWRARRARRHLERVQEAREGNRALLAGMFPHLENPTRLDDDALCTEWERVRLADHDAHWHTVRGEMASRALLDLDDYRASAVGAGRKDPAS